MSDVLNRLVVRALRVKMYPSLPTDIQQLFPTVDDPVLGSGPNILIGHLSEMGANAGFPLITAFSEGYVEALTKGTYRHLSLTLDFWVSAGQALNLAGRRIVSLLYEYTRNVLQDQTLQGIPGVPTDGVSIQRMYEIRASDVLFEPAEKLYHINNVFRVDAVAAQWY